MKINRLLIKGYVYPFIFIFLFMSQTSFANNELVDYSANQPTEEYAQKIIYAYFDMTLKDPYSAKISLSKPHVSTCFAPLRSNKKIRAWRYLATVNAKNSYGAYVGKREYLFSFNGNEVADIFSPETFPECTDISATATPIPTETTTPIVIDTKTPEEATVDFPQPTWCKKVKKDSEKLACNNRDAAMSAISLDNAWDNYQAIHSEDDIKKMRLYLRQQIKLTQACTNTECITKLNDESTEKIQKALKFSPDLKTSYPFFGIKGFNFYGGTGTGRTISISLTGKTKIKGYSHEGVPNDEFEGSYENLAKEGYLIKGNKIYLLEGKETVESCDAKKKDDTEPCVTELYNLYED